MWNMNVFCVWVTLCSCLCLRNCVLFYVGGKKRPYFVHITQNKVLFLIVRKEKRKRNINKSQTADTFCYVYVCACACVYNFYVMCLCQEKNGTLFCANKVLFWPLRKWNVNKNIKKIRLITPNSGYVGNMRYVCVFDAVYYPRQALLWKPLKLPLPMKYNSVWVSSTPMLWWQVRNSAWLWTLWQRARRQECKVLRRYHYPDWLSDYQLFPFQDLLELSECCTFICSETGIDASDFLGGLVDRRSSSHHWCLAGEFC